MKKNTQMGAIALLTATIATSLMGAGCKKLGGAKGDAGETSADGGPKGSGLDAADNDPKVVTMAKAALECSQGSSSSSPFQYDCPAYKAWNEAKLLSGPVDATLLNLLEDKNPRVRYLAARALNDSKALYRTDKAMATRVVSAAEAETAESAAEPVGALLGRIDVDKTGLLESISKVAKTHSIAGLRKEVLDSLLFTNNRSRPTYDFMMSMTNDKEKSVRMTAVRSFWIGGSLAYNETCNMWEKHLTDSEPEIAAKSAELLGMYQHCSNNYDALLTAVNNAATGAGKKESGFVTGIQRMCEDKEAKPAQKSRGATIARVYVKATDNHVFVRKWGLKAVMACDPTGSKGFVAGFTKDKEKWVAEEATELLKPKPKK